MEKKINWLGTYSSKVWNLVPACLMWLVWKERNAQTFENVESPIDMLKTLLARTLFEWSRIWGLTHCSSLSDFLISISLSLWFVCICFKGSEFTIVKTLFFFINKTLIIYPKKSYVFLLACMLYNVICFAFTCMDNVKDV